MRVKEVMTGHAEYIPTTTTLKEAAQKMRDLDCGFLPIGNSRQDKLHGVVTDRDLTVRGIAEGLDPLKATVDEIKTSRVLYCFEDDDIEDAAKRMRDQQVHRLIVLNNRQDKKMCGIITGSPARPCRASPREGLRLRRPGSGRLSRRAP
jgi:CBS domain-containing protein